MSPLEAEKVINKYGAALTVGSEGIARKESLLPCSKAKIRLAFYIYIDFLVKKNLLDQKIGNNLVVSYSAIDSFINDNEAQEINDIGKKLEINQDMDNSLKEKYFQFAGNFVANLKALEEINNYIKECKLN